MKVALPDALHARPASLFVRVASGFSANVTVVSGTRGANGKSILEVLGLAAAKGTEIDLVCEGSDAADAESALVALITGNFSSDLVPETGAAVAPGIAIGRAYVITVDANALAVDDAQSAAARFAEVAKELETDIKALADIERELFAPALAILREVEPRVIALIEAGVDFREAVTRETSHSMTDLFLDVRARLLGEALRVDLGTDPAPRILVAPTLPPSLIATLPSSVVGVVSGEGASEAAYGSGNTSHAAILARSRGIPLAFVGDEVIDAVQSDDLVVLDTTEHASGARVWISPSEDLLRDAEARRDALDRSRRDEATRASAIAAYASFTVRVNVSRSDEAIPEHARGVGLVRTELVFAGRRKLPSVDEQAAAYRAIVSRAHGHPVSIRLFDAGGDKPLPWLAVADPELRGAELLLLHEDVLRSQLAAIFEARAAGDAKALIPLARTAEDVHRIRALAPKGLPVGAMIETREAADLAHEIAAVADFLSIGTNDLTASVLELPRADASRGLETPVWSAILRVVEAARAHGRDLTVCGELAAHSEAGPKLLAAGVTALSVAVPVFSRVVEGLAKTRLTPE